MLLGWDAPESADAVCAVKVDQDRNICAAVLAFGFSTGAERDSPEYQPNKVAALTIMEDIETAIEQVMSGVHWKDLRVVTAVLSDALKKCDLKLQTYGQAIARGVYVGGCILYSIFNSVVVLPFGGGLVYKWDGKELYRLCGGVAEDHMIRDAIGAQGYLNIVPWYDTLESGHRLFLTSDAFNNIPTCKEIIQEEFPFASDSSTATLLRRQLENAGCRPAAIIDFH